MTQTLDSTMELERFVTRGMEAQKAVNDLLADRFKDLGVAPNAVNMARGLALEEQAKSIDKRVLELQAEINQLRGQAKRLRGEAYKAFTDTNPTLFDTHAGNGQPPATAAPAEITEDTPAEDPKYDTAPRNLPPFDEIEETHDAGEQVDLLDRAKTPEKPEGQASSWFQWAHNIVGPLQKLGLDVGGVTPTGLALDLFLAGCKPAAAAKLYAQIKDAWKPLPAFEGDEFDVPDVLSPGAMIGTTYGAGAIGRVIDLKRDMAMWSITYVPWGTPANSKGGYRENDKLWINGVRVQNGKIYSTTRFDQPDENNRIIVLLQCGPGEEAPTLAAAPAAPVKEKPAKKSKRGRK